jgi:hypothetical protein
MIRHISDDDLERYYLGMIKEEAQLVPLEEHLIGCPHCVGRAEAAQDYVDTIRAALIRGKYDMFLPATAKPARVPHREPPRDD